MLITDSEQFSTVINWMNDQKVIGIDTETTGLSSFHGKRIAGISLAGLDEKSFYLPFRHGTGENLDMELMSVFIKNMGAYSGQLVYWNAMFDLHMFCADGYNLPQAIDMNERSKVEDAMIAAHIMNENEVNYQLKNTADRYGIGRGSLDEEDLKGEVIKRWKLGDDGKRLTDKSWKGMMWKLPAEVVSAYAETDAVLTLKLREFYLPHLKSFKLDDLYLEVCEYMMTLTRMEQRGVQLDVELIHQYRAEAEEKTQEYIAWFEQRTGIPGFNPNSVPQIKRFFGWPVTDEDALHDLIAQKNEDATRLLEFRKWSKVNTTYYDKWLEFMDDKHTLRASTNIIGTETGRLSQRSPNLQAVSRKTEIYKQKDVVVARPGYELLEIDLSQAELRLACLAPDTLIDTPVGYVRIDTLKEGDKVWAFQSGDRRIGTIEQSMSRGIQESYKITFDNGESVVASEDHRWPTMTSEKRTHELVVGEQMVPDHKIVSIERIGSTSVWSIATDGDHNYFLSSGVLTYNCHYADERVMGEILARGGDIHTETSTDLKIPRDVAKTVNFCLHPDTLVFTPEGNRAISSLESGDKVWAYKNGKPSIGMVVRSAVQDSMEAYRITFDNGESVIASENHRWPVQQNGYIEIVNTKDLAYGQRMIPIRKCPKGGGRIGLYTTDFFEYVYEHVVVCESYHGSRPENHDVHHIDENYTNNHPSNLQWLADMEHRKLHNPRKEENKSCPNCGKIFYNPPSWGVNVYCSKECELTDRSAVGICPICGKEYAKRTIRGRSYCSKSCNQTALRYKRLGIPEKKACTMCGSEFTVYPVSTQTLCSKKCRGVVDARKHRDKLREQRQTLNHKITSIEPIGVQPMWSIETDGDNNYYLSCGVLTMNSAVYGVGAKTYAKTYHYPFEQAQIWLRAYHKRYPGFKRFYYAMDNAATAAGFIRLDTGRMRRYRMHGLHVAETHKASSNWVQGTVGEVMRIAMRRIDRQIRDHDVHILLTIHDSLLFEIPEGTAHYWANILAHAMCDFNFDPPLSAEAKVGKRWGEMVKFKLEPWATFRQSKYVKADAPEGKPVGVFVWKQ